MSQTQEQGFSLVSGLAAELSKGDLKLPSLPESVIRIKNALAEPDFTVEELARLIRPEPSLTGSILTMANSVAFKRAGNETTDLKIAISRIGSGMVQTAATTFALRQLREGAEFKDVEHLLAPEWAKATRAAAAIYLVAQVSRKAKPDEAMVVGLMHNIGRIYLYSRAKHYPDLFSSPADVESLLSSWHASVGKAIVEHWNLPADAALAIERQDEISDEEEIAPMVNILTAGIAIVALGEEPSPEELSALAARVDFKKLGLSEDIIAEIAGKREELRQELGLSIH